MRISHINKAGANSQAKCEAAPLANKQATIYDDDYRRVIDSLVAYRKSQGLTQSQLADKMGMPQYDISKVENFVRRLDVAELDRWLRAMGVKGSLVEHVCKLTKC